MICLQVTYEGGRPLIAYIQLDGRPGRKCVRTEEVTPDLVVDYAEDETPLGIEVLSPEVVSLETIFQLDRLGIERPRASELKPLRAA